LQRLQPASRTRKAAEQEPGRVTTESPHQPSTDDDDGKAAAPGGRAGHRHLSGTGRGAGLDTYWDIAGAYCGGGQHWTTIWSLNRGRTQADGEVMTQPGLLKPDWTVLIPADTVSTPPTAAGLEQVVTVRPGDTLSGIAAHGLPNWRQAWQASRGRAEPGGQQFTEPDLIRPGWPVDTLTRPGAAARTTPAVPAPGHGTSAAADSPPAVITHPPHPGHRPRTAGNCHRDAQRAVPGRADGPARHRTYPRRPATGTTDRPGGPVG